MRSRAYITWIGFEGALMALSPFPFLFLLPIAGTDLSDNIWQLAAAAISVSACLMCAFTLFRKPAATSASAVCVTLDDPVFRIAPPPTDALSGTRTSEGFLPCQAKNQRPAATGPQTA